MQHTAQCQHFAAAWGGQRVFENADQTCSGMQKRGLQRTGFSETHSWEMGLGTSVGFSGGRERAAGCRELARPTGRRGVLQSFARSWDALLKPPNGSGSERGE